MGPDLGPVLVTGAAGYLGRRVLANLTAKGLPCVPTSLSGSVGDACDLTDPTATRALLDATMPSAVIHCAAIVPKTTVAYGDDSAADRSVTMLKTVAVQARCPIVLASSMTVYGDAPDCPVDETWPCPPARGYARGKWTAEQLLFDRHHTDDVALRMPGLFGLPRRAGVLYNGAKAFLTRGHFELSAQSGAWAAMHVDDAAEYLVRAATAARGCAAEAVNVGYAGEFTVAFAVAQIASACGVAWRRPLETPTPFSMRLSRLASRYGMLPTTFAQRLGEFVEVIRRDG